MSTTPAIEVDALTQRYTAPRSLNALLRRRPPPPSVLALDRVSFSVAQGEVLGLLGPNGAGKTTLINVLCTLLTPTSGRAAVGGCDVAAQARAARRQVGLVTSNERSFYWRLTGRQNLRFFAHLYHVPAAEVERRIDEFLHALDLSAFADRRFDGYSTGIRQRFAFARALLHRPRILFMDEPTKGLDPHAAAVLLQVIRERILPAWHPTIVVTSHNLVEIEKLCHRVAIMDHGRLRRIGTISELAREVRSHQAYAIQVDAAPAAALAALQLALNPGHVRVRDTAPLTLELAVADGAGLSRALACLLERGLTIRRCEPIDVSLEDVFRHTLAQKEAA